MQSVNENKNNERRRREEREREREKTNAYKVNAMMMYFTSHNTYTRARTSRPIYITHHQKHTKCVHEREDILEKEYLNNA